MPQRQWRSSVLVVGSSSRSASFEHRARRALSLRRTVCARRSMSARGSWSTSWTRLAGYSLGHSFIASVIAREERAPLPLVPGAESFRRSVRRRARSLSFGPLLPHRWGTRVEEKRPPRPVHAPSRRPRGVVSRSRETDDFVRLELPDPTPPKWLSAPGSPKRADPMGAAVDLALTVPGTNPVPARASSIRCSARRSRRARFEARPSRGELALPDARTNPSFRSFEALGRSGDRPGGDGRRSRSSPSIPHATEGTREGGDASEVVPPRGETPSLPPDASRRAWSVGGRRSDPRRGERPTPATARTPPALDRS